jgi:AraC family transcriptional regulator
MEPDITLSARRIRCVATPSCALIEAAYAPGVSLPPHAHEHPNISLVLAGAIEERNDGRGAHEAAACSVFLKPAGSVHSNRFGARGARTFVMELTNGLADALHERLPPGAPPVWLDEVNAARALLDAHRAARAGDPHAAARAEDSVFTLLALLDGPANRAASAPAWVRRVRQRIDDAPEQAPTVRELAAEAGVHPVHLARVFRQAYGCGVAEHQRRARVRHAAQRLGAAREPLARVALASGFADQSHMGRDCRRELGVTPASLRALLCE